MKITILRAAAAISLAAAALLAPTAANAYVDPSVAVATPSSIAPGQSSTFTTNGAPFTGDEEVLISITGENASGVTLGMVKAIVQTNTTLRAHAKAGALAVPITFPANASGTYALTFTGATSGTVVRSQVTVSSASASPSTPPSTGGLAKTGIDGGATTGLWIAGGALVVAGAAVGAGAVLRRRQRVTA
ncbi:hypothetical protein NS220_11130 [Microbacterium testaceum]|uniref:Gram-positive cocci surface proteins LPxTG domain-containing protein n=1 Tax=Microbacterium testaceum TaxID=2033 RepID=A0A147EW21_MICTE|nr:hypothetical protein [Microbacterium testaceum]KTR93846.1 hypothetical protein NS220_11130 [Microbacterium testaceum]